MKAREKCNAAHHQKTLGIPDLNEEPFSGKTLLHPYGQQPVPQMDDSEYIDPRASINFALYFIELFWEAWIRNMSPHLYCAKNGLDLGII